LGVALGGVKTDQAHYRKEQYSVIAMMVHLGLRPEEHR